MAVEVSRGGVPLKLEASLDTKSVEKAYSDMFKRIQDQTKQANAAFRKDMEATLKSITKITDVGKGSSNNSTSSGSAKNTNDAKAAQLAFMDSIRQLRAEIITLNAEMDKLRVQEQQAAMDAQRSRAAMDALNQSERALINEYRQGKIDLNNYTLEQKKLSDAQKAAAATQREAERAARATEKARRDAEAAARRTAAEAEKRRKQLERENSAYGQLNSALNNLRKQSKDVLAAMFQLELAGKKDSLAYQDLANKARGLTAQTNLLDRGIKKIDTSLGLHQRFVGQYGIALDAISPTFARLNSQLALLGVNLAELAGSRNGFQQLGATLLSFGRSIGAFLLSPVGLVITALAGLFALIKGNAATVKQFNSGLLNVSKTTGIAGADLDSLGDSLVNLSRKLQTVSVDKLLEYATVAGQLGVKGTSNILAFTEALAKLETATDISGEKGGAEIARLLTLTDGGVQNVKAFGDEIVNLGNNFAATEGEILTNAEAVSQNTGLYKIGRQDVLAYATATKALGLEAEVVGSSFGRALGGFEKIIRTGKGVDGLLSIIGGTAAQLSARFKTDASGVFQDYVRGLNRIYKEGGSVNAALTQTGVVAVRDQRVIATLASNGFDILNQAMQTVKDSAGALDQEFTTAAGKLENQTKRIGIAWDNLVLNIDNGTGAIGKATVWLSDFFATALEGFTNVVTSKSWGEFWDRINPANWGAGDAITDAIGFKKVFEEVKKFNNDVNKGTGTFEWLKNDMMALNDSDFNKALESAKENYEKATKAAINYEAAVLSGRIKEDRLTVAAYKKQEDLANVHYLNMQRIQAGRPRSSTASSTTSAASTVPLTEAQKRAAAAAIERQRDLQQKIDEINQQALRSSLNKDESEVESVKDKYRKIREEIDKFNRDPRNKGQKVDASGLVVSESMDIKQATYKQDTAELIKELDIQRKLWEDFEAWRLQFGEKSAKERYANELPLIEGFRSKLAEAAYTLGSTPMASTNGKGTTHGLTQAEQERLKALLAMQEELDKQDQAFRDERFRRALADTQTYKQRRQKIVKEAEERILSLQNKGYTDQAIIAGKQRDEDLVSLDEEYLNSRDVIKAVYQDLEDMSAKQATEAIKKAQQFFDDFISGAGLSAEEVEKLRKEFDKLFRGASASVRSKLTDGLRGFGDVISNIGAAVGQVNEGFGQSLSTLGNMVSAAADVKKNIDAIKDIQEKSNNGGSYDTMAAATSVAGIYGAILSAVGGLFQGFITRSIQKQEEEFAYRQKQQTEQTDALTKALNRQLDLIKDIYGTDRLKEYQKSLAEIQKQENDIRNNLSGKVLYTGTNKDIDDVITMYNTGKTTIEDLNNALRTQKALANNATSAIDQLFAANRARALQAAIDAINSGIKLTGKETTTELLAIYASLDEGSQKAIDELIAKEDQAKDTLNMFRSELTGTSFESLADSIVDMFQKGTVAASDFADNFEKLMRTSIINTFKQNLLAGPLQDFYNQFADSVESDGLSTDEIDKLRSFYNSIIANAGDQFDELKKLGIDLIDGDSTSGSQSGLKSGVERMTEQTADELTGLFRATYDLEKKNSSEMLALMNAKLAALNEIKLNTGQTAINTARLEAIEGYLFNIAKATANGSITYNGRPY